MTLKALSPALPAVCLLSGFWFELPAQAGLPTSPNNASLNSMVDYLDALQNCTPSTYSTPFVLLGDGTIAHTIIQGQTGDRCAVTTIVEIPGESGTPSRHLLSQCNYSQATISLLTDAQGYQEAAAWDQGNMSLDLDWSDPRVAALSENLGQDCVFPGQTP